MKERFLRKLIVKTIDGEKYLSVSIPNRLNDRLIKYEMVEILFDESKNNLTINPCLVKAVEGLEGAIGEKKNPKKTTDMMVVILMTRRTTGIQGVTEYSAIR